MNKQQMTQISKVNALGAQLHRVFHEISPPAANEAQMRLAHERLAEALMWAGAFIFKPQIPKAPPQKSPIAAAVEREIAQAQEAGEPVENVELSGDSELENDVETPAGDTTESDALGKAMTNEALGNTNTDSEATPESETGE